MYRINDFPVVSESFKYKDTFEAQRPAHERFDSFSIKHPAMDLGKRAKIFSPFDALKGFKDAIDQVDRQSSLSLNTENTE
ncbi:MAG: hypothetical protein IKW90_10605 [Lachnospiraceae bacterium]|nr:hypothetical protein [Lachnospiraceae bacterium]